MDSQEELVAKLIKIRDSGFVKSNRTSDTGIGKTLEDLLGIKENNIALPDVGEIEIKSQRIESDSMLTIATKAPKPRGVNKKLYDAYKYIGKDGVYCLHTTSYGSRPNNLSFQVIFENDTIILDNAKKIQAYWPLTIFDDVLKSKSGKILLAFAETSGERATKSEQFHFIEAYLLSGMDFNKFKSAITTDKLKVDTRIGTFKSGKLQGKYHDHGTGFRINKKDFLSLFTSYRRLI